MGAHKSVSTHRTRSFVNKNIPYSDLKDQLWATRGQWQRWFAINKSVNTVVTKKSYAQVLKNGKSLLGHKERVSKQMSFIKATKPPKTPVCKLTQASGRAVSKCIHSERTPTQSACLTQSKSLYGDCDVVDQSLNKGNRIGEEFPVITSNRFEILTSMGDLQNDDHQQTNCDTFQTNFKGNKNKTGPTLGLLCHKTNPDVYVSKILEGNKNKTRKKLGDDT